MKIINDMLLQAFLVFLFAGCVTSLFVGIGMLFRPEGVAQLNQRLSRWISTNKLEKDMDRPHWTERVFYRHHRLLGVVLLGIAIFFLLVILPKASLLTALLRDRATGWLPVTMVWIFLAAIVLAAVVGTVVLVRPSLLRKIEKVSNRWTPTDGLLETLNSPHYSLEQHVIRHMRMVGILVVLGSAYAAAVLGYLLLSGMWKL